MLAHLPALCHVYGLKPWEVDRMTFREIRRFLADLHARTQKR